MRRRREERRPLFYLLFIPIFVILLTLYLWARFEIFELANLREDLRARKRELRYEIDGLKAEINRLSSRRQVENFALRVLNMRYPRYDEIIILREEEDKKP